MRLMLIDPQVGHLGMSFVLMGSILDLFGIADWLIVTEDGLKELRLRSLIFIRDSKTIRHSSGYFFWSFYCQHRNHVFLWQFYGLLVVLRKHYKYQSHLDILNHKLDILS